jgi:hypothetical protein
MTYCVGRKRSIDIDADPLNRPFLGTSAQNGEKRECGSGLSAQDAVEKRSIRGIHRRDGRR